MARYSESIIPNSALVRLAGATAPEKGDHAPQAHQRPHPFEQQKAPLRLDHRYHAEHGRTYDVHHRIREVRRPYEPELVGGVGSEDGEGTENRYHLQHKGTSGVDETAAPATISEGWLRLRKKVNRFAAQDSSSWPTSTGFAALMRGSSGNFSMVIPTCL